MDRRLSRKICIPYSPTGKLTIGILIAMNSGVLNFFAQDKDLQRRANLLARNGQDGAFSVAPKAVARGNEREIFIDGKG